MKRAENRKEITRKLLTEHYRRYPKLDIEDMFKYIFQSAFGCEHLVSDGDAVLSYIRREYEAVPGDAVRYTEPLDGDYSRVYLSHLNYGLSPDTLARIFCLSAKKEDGLSALEEKIQSARELIEEGVIALDLAAFEDKLSSWRELAYPAVHHSDSFRREYHPAYRVVSKRYSEILPLLAEIDRLLVSGNVTVAIEGGSASGKSTLADILSEVYGCNVFHMDDFFLRPEQRTSERLSEIGGNIDRERFAKEVLEPLKNGGAVTYRPFDCGTQTLGESITVSPNRLTVIEGVYSMHPAFGDCYDLRVFLDVSAECQRDRILKRNSERLAQRFFDEWIPLENDYFAGAAVKERCTLVMQVGEKSVVEDV